MDLPDESQWDETTCNSAVCQHPQCWATIRRIERGHPRILGPSPCRTPRDVEDKLPVVTIVNLSDSCFQAERCPHHCLPGFTFAKPSSLLSQDSKLDSKFQGRPWKDLPAKDWIRFTKGSSTSRKLKKLPVLNLNETQLPCSQDVRNMVVVWIPKEPEDHVGPAEKCVVPQHHRKKKRKTPAVKDKLLPLLPEKQDIAAQLEASGLLVPPPTPIRLFEQLSPKFLPFWSQFNTVPQSLLNDLLSDAEKTTPGPELKTQLAMMKKKPPLAKSRPDSAISSKMFLSVHRLALQRPALRYPEHLKMESRFSDAARSLGCRKQQQQQLRQQQRMLKTPTKKQEAKKKPKSDPGSQSTSYKHLGDMVCDPHYGHRTLPGQEGDKEQQQLMEDKGSTLKQQRVYEGHSARAVSQDSTERPQMDYAEMDSFASKQNPKLSKTESTNEDISTQTEVVSKVQERTSKDPSASMPGTSWKPELKLLRILQSTDYEDKESELPGMQGEESLEA